MARKDYFVRGKVSREEYELLKALAEREYRTLSGMIRVALLAYADQREVSRHAPHHDHHQPEPVQSRP